MCGIFALEIGAGTHSTMFTFQILTDLPMHITHVSKPETLHFHHNGRAEPRTWHTVFPGEERRSQNGAAMGQLEALTLLKRISGAKGTASASEKAPRKLLEKRRLPLLSHDYMDAMFDQSERALAKQTAQTS